MAKRELLTRRACSVEVKPQIAVIVVMEVCIESNLAVEGCEVEAVVLRKMIELNRASEKLSVTGIFCKLIQS